MLLTDATVPDGTTASIRMVGGMVTALGPLVPTPGEETLDLTGYVVLPALVEPHIHLDKIFSAPTGADPGRAPLAEVGGEAAEPIAGLRDAIGRHEAAARASDPVRADTADRAERALRAYLANGTTAVRCHVGCGRTFDAASLAAVLDVRERMRGLVELQIVADIGWPQGVSWPEHVQHLRAALEAGADLVGGYPSLEADPEDALDACLQVARKYGRGVDFHLDEVLDPDDQDVRQLARRVLTDPLPGTVTASHCVALGCCEPAMQREISSEIAAAGISVITNPMTNLYLQDRPAAQLRGLTAIPALQEAGVTVAAGSDNIQDAFNPMGRCDPLEVASLLVTAAQCEIGEAFAMVSGAARAILGLPPAGPWVGGVADLVAVRADSMTQAVAGAPADRLVFSGGRLVARTRLDRWIDDGRGGGDGRSPSPH